LALHLKDSLLFDVHSVLEVSKLVQLGKENFEKFVSAFSTFAKHLSLQLLVKAGLKLLEPANRLPFNTFQTMLEQLLLNHN
jgi:hypothetical protein